MEANENPSFTAVPIARLLVVRWHGRTTREAAEQAFQAVETHSAKHGPFPLLLLHHSSDPAPTPGGMRAIMSVLPAIKRLTLFRVALIQGEGFGAAVVHASHGRLMLLSPSKTLFVERDVAEAMARVCDAAGMSATDLANTLRDRGLLSE